MLVFQDVQEFQNSRLFPWITEILSAHRDTNSCGYHYRLMFAIGKSKAAEQECRAPHLFFQRLLVSTCSKPKPLMPWVIHGEKDSREFQMLKAYDLAVVRLPDLRTIPSFCRVRFLLVDRLKAFGLQRFLSILESLESVPSGDSVLEYGVKAWGIALFSVAESQDVSAP